MKLYAVTLERTRGVCGGRPVLAGTRLEPHHLYSFFDSGWTTARVIAEAYPHLTRAQVLFCKALWREMRRWYAPRRKHG